MYHPFLGPFHASFHIVLYLYSNKNTPFGLLTGRGEALQDGHQGQHRRRSCDGPETYHVPQTGM